MTNYDLEREYLLEQLAAGNVSEETPLHDLRKLFLAKSITNNVIPVFPGDDIQDAIDAVVTAAGWIKLDQYDSAELTFLSNMADGDRIIVSADYSPVKAEFKTSGSAAAGWAKVDISGGATPTACAIALQAVLDSYSIPCSRSGATLTITNTYDGVFVWAASSLIAKVSVIPGPAYAGGYQAYCLDTLADDYVTPLVLVQPGAYTGGVDVWGSVIIEARGVVTLDGNITSGSVVAADTFGFAPTQWVRGDLTATLVAAALLEPLAVNSLQIQKEENTVINVSDEGYFTGVGDIPVGGSLQKPPSIGTLIDRAMPGPFFTDANAIVCIVSDDAQAYGWTNNTFADLGDVTPLAYAQSKGIPINWGVVRSSQEGTNGIPTATLTAFIKVVGGEVGNHSYDHLNSPDPALSTYAGALKEIITSKAYIDGAFPWDALTMLHWGSAGLTSDPTTIMGAMVRQSHLCCRAGATFAKGTFPLGRYPTPCLKLTGLGDDQSGVQFYRRLVGTLAASRGIALSFYIHGVKATKDDSYLTPLQFKALIDELADRQFNLSGGQQILILPQWQACATYPVYSPNLIPNPGFEFTDTSGDDLFSFGFLPSADPYFDAHKWIQTVLGSGSTASIEIDDKHGGANALKLVKTTNGCALKYNYLQVQENANYILSWWQKKTAGAGTGDIVVTVS